MPIDKQYPRELSRWLNPGPETRALTAAARMLVAGRSQIDAAENRRLLELARFRMLHATENPRIGQIARTTARCLRVPFVSISLFVGENRVWRIAGVGLTCNTYVDGQTLIEMALERQAPLRVDDLALDPRLANHVLRLPPVGARSTAIVPFKGSDGNWAGSLSIWSPTLRSFTDDEMELLGAFAEIAAAELDGYHALYESTVRDEFFRCILDDVSCGIALTRKDGTRVTVNNRYAPMLGYTIAEMMNQQFYKVVHPDHVDEIRTKHDAWSRGEIESFENRFKLLRKNGGVIWVHVKSSTMVVPGSHEPYAIAIIEDVDRVQQGEIARDILIAEINHRVKNTLAITQGLSKQIWKIVASPDDFVGAFENRITALSESYDLLTENVWEPVGLSVLIGRLLETWAPYREQIRVAVPNTALNSQTTVMLWLILNELMTNAVKHGALRTPDGTVALTAVLTERDETPLLNLRWRETTPSPLTHSGRKGVGSYLIERASRLGLGGEGSLRFTPTGIVCEIAFPVYATHYTALDHGAGTDDTARRRSAA